MQALRSFWHNWWPPIVVIGGLLILLIGFTLVELYVYIPRETRLAIRWFTLGFIGGMSFVDLISEDRPFRRWLRARHAPHSSQG